jgi:tetratricopeptide (TPR) repeat protein
MSMYKILYNNLVIAIVACFTLSCCNSKTETDQQTTEQSITTPKELSELNEKLKKDSANPALYFERARYFMNIHDYNAALIDMSRVMHMDSAKAEYYITLSDLYLYTNQTGKSKTVLEKCISVDPKNTDAMLKLAELYFYVKKYQESVNYINGALKVNNYIAKAYFLKGMNFKELGDTAKAISAMSTATEQDPEYYSAYMELGVMYAAQKNKLAISYYDNALRINANSTDALYNKGKFYQDIKDWDDAINMYTVLLKLDPKNKHAHFNLGAISLIKKEYDKAIGYFTNAINDDAKYPEAFFARATTYMQKGDKAKAKADYQMAVQIDPNYQPAQDALSTLSQGK